MPFPQVAVIMTTTPTIKNFKDFCAVCSVAHDVRRCTLLWLNADKHIYMKNRLLITFQKVARVVKSNVKLLKNELFYLFSTNDWVFCFLHTLVDKPGFHSPHDPILHSNHQHPKSHTIQRLKPNQASRTPAEPAIWTKKSVNKFFIRNINLSKA